MNDEQINVPRCTQCKLKWSKTAPMTYITDEIYCGECALKLMKAMNNVWLEEAKRRVEW